MNYKQYISGTIKNAVDERIISYRNTEILAIQTWASVPSLYPDKTPGERIKLSYVVVPGIIKGKEQQGPNEVSLVELVPLEQRKTLEEVLSNRGLRGHVEFWN